ncbi:MAG: hypothetical protein J6Q92_05255 [Oscillospiraceae bacterium]|nr:hypothetical protein [Oscillospiraceae bacterium]
MYAGRVNADGSIIIDTRIDTVGFSKGAANLKSQFKGLSGAAGKLGIAIAAAFSVREIVAFGKEAIKLGSDLQEVQNVVDVTFTTMNEQVNEFTKNAAKTAGLSETMAKRYVGTFGAMAKSFRFTEEEAYNMSTSLTQLAGDVASFYNLTQDEAYTKLKSVFTGETESLKDLGVVMTQTALDDYALRKGLGKTTDQMSEQEKVALRYQFVLEQLSGASGDFLRTSNSWANQTRLLTLQFDQLKATIGQGLINVLTPAVKMLNELLEKLQTTADAFKTFTESVFGDASGGMQSSVAGAADSAGDLEQNIEQAGKEAKKLISGFDELNIIGSDSSGNSAGNIPIPGVGKTEGGDDAPAEAPGWMTALAEGIKQLIEPIQDIDFKALKKEISGLTPAFKELASTISGQLRWAWINVLAPMSEWTMEETAPEAVNTFSIALSALSALLAPVYEGLQYLYNVLSPIVTFIKDNVLMVFDKWQYAFSELSTVFEENGPEITDSISDIGDIVVYIWNAIEPILKLLRLLWGQVLGYMIDKATGTISRLISEFSAIIDFIKFIFTADLEELFEGIVKLIEGDIDYMFGKMEAFFNFFGLEFDFDKIKDGFKGMINSVIGFLNKLISGVVSGINYVVDAINTLSFDVPDWIPGIGGKTFGFNLDNVTAPQIPYLAQGAVIPPRAPFMAVLGDQRNGTNIEAPLSTIEEAVARVTSEQSERMVAALYTLIEIVEQKDLNVQIGDDEIGRANARYKQTRGVQVNSGAFANAY